MFNNSGGKIKGLSKFVFVILVLLFLIIGITLIVMGSQYDMTGMIVSGVITLILGFIEAWLATIFVYAFGELVEDTETNRETNEMNLEATNELLKTNIEMRQILFALLKIQAPEYASQINVRKENKKPKQVAQTQQDQSDNKYDQAQKIERDYDTINNQKTTQQATKGVIRPFIDLFSNEEKGKRQKTVKKQQFCRYCGAKNEGGTYCIECGERLD